MKLSKAKIMVILAERGMTTAQAAELFGMKANNFSALLSRGSCRPVTAGKVAAALNVPVTSIIEE